ncbi:MAG: hypothetical protein FWF09_02615 [Bacteroidales bacterium]|nr:hypothetical protein [Bacteroidales bacterium]
MKAKKIILFIFWLLVFVGVVYVVVRAGSVCDQRTCKKYSIKIEVEYPADTLLYIADIENVILEHDSIIGKPYNEIDIYTIESVLKQHPYISNVAITGDLLGTLRIAITQRIPIMRVINKLGESFYLDETAQVMPVRSGASAHVIAVSGNIDTTKHEWNALVNCVKYINNDTFLKNQIGQIYIEDKDSYHLIPVIGNHLIIFGTPEHPEKRLERLKIFYQKVIDEEGWKTYKSINLKYKNQIVCKK